MHISPYGKITTFHERQLDEEQSKKLYCISRSQFVRKMHTLQVSEEDPVLSLRVSAEDQAKPAACKTCSRSPSLSTLQQESQAKPCCRGTGFSHLTLEPVEPNASSLAWLCTPGTWLCTPSTSRPYSSSSPFLSKFSRWPQCWGRGDTVILQQQTCHVFKPIPELFRSKILYSLLLFINLYRSANSVLKYKVKALS